MSATRTWPRFPSTRRRPSSTKNRSRSPAAAAGRADKCGQRTRDEEEEKTEARSSGPARSPARPQKGPARSSNGAARGMMVQNLQTLRPSAVHAASNRYDFRIGRQRKKLQCPQQHKYFLTVHEKRLHHWAILYYITYKLCSVIVWCWGH